MYFKSDYFKTSNTLASKDFSYKLQKSDYTILSLGLSCFITGAVLKENQEVLSPNEILALDKNDINKFDRSATENWSVTADRFSDVRAINLLAPGLIGVPMIINHEWGDITTLGVMYLEVFFFTKGITDIVKYTTDRKRPFLYNTMLTDQERIRAGRKVSGYSSFFSGHTSSSFASAVFLSKIYTDTYGKSKWSRIVWGSSLTIAGISGYTRYAAGKHYPTDIIAGAIVGSIIGYTIPVLHKAESNKLNMVILPSGFKFCYQF